MKRLVLAALLLAGCTPTDERPIAEGSMASMLNASRVARRCGVRDTRIAPDGTSHARLMMGRNHPAGTEQCLVRWIETHPKGIDIDKPQADDDDDDHA